jgi:hypothetical protein
VRLRRCGRRLAPARVGVASTDMRLQLPRCACALWFTGGERPLLGMMRLDGAGRASSAGPSFQGYGSPVTLPTCSDRWCEEDGWCPYWGRFAGSPLSGRAPSPAASSLSVAAWCCGRDVLCAVSLRRLLSPWVTLHMVVLAAPRWWCERRRAFSALVDVWLWMLCEACCYCLARCMLQVGDALGESLYWQSCGGVMAAPPLRRHFLFWERIAGQPLLQHGVLEVKTLSIVGQEWWRL